MHTGMHSFSGLVVLGCLLSEKSSKYAPYTVQEMLVILVDVNFEQAPGLYCFSQTTSSCISELFKLLLVFIVVTSLTFWLVPVNIDPSCRISADDVSDQSKCQDMFFFCRTRRRTCTREISVHLLWRITSTKPSYPKLCRSVAFAFSLIFIVAWTVSLNIVITALCSYEK